MFDPNKFKRVLVISAENKGGAGKTLAAQIAVEALSTALRQADWPDGKPEHFVHVIDADAGNQSLAAVTKDAVTINLNERESMGAVFLAIDGLKDGKFGSVVMDTAGGDEFILRKKLPEIVRLCDAAGIRVIVIRPITLSSFVQMNAAKFADMFGDMLDVIIALNLGQGREIEFFEPWFQGAPRKLALSKAIEIKIEDAGVRWADEASGVNLTVADAALSRFESLSEEQQKRMQTIFTDSVRRWLHQWMTNQVTTMATAMQEVLKRPKGAQAIKRPAASAVAASPDVAASVAAMAHAAP